MKEKKSNNRSRRFFRILLWCFLAVAVLAGAAYYTVFHINQFFLMIRLNGETEMRLEYGDSYEEPGAELWLCGSLFWQEGVLLEQPEIQIEGSISEKDLGRQELAYTAALYSLRAEAKRSVHVLDTVPPVLVLEEPEEEYVPGTPFAEPGYTATDNHDGDVTERVVRTEKPGQLVYAVTDLSGNPAVVKRSVPGFDPQPPVITLEGGEDYRIRVGTHYEEPGYSAWDNCDGEITHKVAVTGTVRSDRPGTYQIHYTVADKSGNTDTQIRTVKVKGRYLSKRALMRNAIAFALPRYPSTAAPRPAASAAPNSMDSSGFLFVSDLF